MIGTASSDTVKPTRPFRTVLVGLGRIGARYGDDPKTARFFRYATHAQVLAEHPAFNWQAAVDGSSEAVDFARSRWNVSLCTTQLQKAATIEPEIAVLAIPPDDRLKIIEQLPSLKAVIVEKPLARNAEIGHRFLKICRERNIAVQVNYWRRVDRLTRHLAAGQLVGLVGNPQAIFGLYGSGLRNNGSHMIDLARMLLGEVASVQATGEPQASSTMPGDVELTFQLRMQSGVPVVFAPVDYRHFRELSLDILGNRGRLQLTQEGLQPIFHTRQPHRAMECADEIASDRPYRLVTTAGDALYQLYENLANHLTVPQSHPVPLFSSGDSALASEKVVQAVLRSSVEGRREIEPFPTETSSSEVA